MPVKYVAAGAAVAIAGIVGYAAWSANAKRAEARAIAAVLTEANAGLNQSLKQPSPELAARLEAAGKSLHDIRVKRMKPYADAADVYLVSARAIARRQADAQQLRGEAEEARAALLTHMRGPRGRDGAWIGRAADLRRTMDRKYADLARVQAALIDLLRTLPDAERPLAAHTGGGAFADPELRAAALSRAEADLKRFSAQAEEARRLH